MLHGWYSVIGVVLILLLPPNMASGSILVLSDHMIFSHASSASSRWSVANFNSQNYPYPTKQDCVWQGSAIKFGRGPDIFQAITWRATMKMIGALEMIKQTHRAITRHSRGLMWVKFVDWLFGGAIIVKKNTNKKEQQQHFHVLLLAVKNGSIKKSE